MIVESASASTPTVASGCALCGQPLPQTAATRRRPHGLARRARRRRASPGGAGDRQRRRAGRPSAPQRHHDGEHQERERRQEQRRRGRACRASVVIPSAGPGDPPCTVRRMRKSRMTMARPSAASATVMQMVNTVKTMPGGVAAEPREGDQVDVDGVQHQLDAEQDADGVAARHHAEEADAEERPPRASGRPGAPSASLPASRSRSRRAAPPASARPAARRAARTASARSRRSSCVRSPAIGGFSRASGLLADDADECRPAARRDTPAPAAMPRLVCEMRSPTSRSVTTMAKTTIVMMPPA